MPETDRHPTLSRRAFLAGPGAAAVALGASRPRRVAAQGKPGGTLTFTSAALPPSPP